MEKTPIKDARFMIEILTLGHQWTGQGRDGRRMLKGRTGSMLFYSVVINA